jgi:hypothetical protein
MKSFHRTKKDSKILGVFGLSICLVLSLVFMLIGFHNTGSEGRFSFELIFGLVGIVVFIIFVRGAWMMTGGSLIHVFSVDSSKLIWGFIGKEKELDITTVDQIYWDDSDGFTLMMTTKDGQQIRFPYIQSTVTHKSRSELLRFFRTAFPRITIQGNIDKRTEQESLTR